MVSIRVIHRAFDLGVTFLDTADAYGPHTNEVLVGKALSGHRHQVTLATKFGIVRNLPDPMQRSFNGRPEYVKASCEGSLKRLNVDVIDLYYLHRVDRSTPIEETVGAMGDLVRAGKILGLGLSEVSADTLRRAHKAYPITAVQSEYSLWSREPEEEILAVCKELGIAFVPYSPLSRGFLSGKIRKIEDFEPGDFRRNVPRFQGENFQKNLDIVQKLEDLARLKGCTPSQLALAWVISKSDYLFPIPGTTRINHLEENVGALAVRFTAAELKDIDRISPAGAVAGTRYAEAGMKAVNG